MHDVAVRKGGVTTCSSRAIASKTSELK